MKFRYIVLLSILLISIIVAAAVFAPRDGGVEPAVPGPNDGIADVHSVSDDVSADETTSDASISEPGEPVWDTGSLSGWKKDWFVAAMNSLDYDLESLSPYQQYANNIDAAESGDARSQYRVASALATCDESVRKADLPKYRSGQNTDSEILATIEYWSYRCESLHDLMTADELKRKRNEWIQKSLAQDYPLAVLLEYSADLPPEINRRELIADALAEDDEGIYRLLMFYHARLDIVGSYESTSWGLHACAVDPTCESDELLHVYLTEYHETQSKMILETTVKIRDAIDNKDWDSILPKH